MNKRIKFNRQIKRGPIGQPSHDQILIRNANLVIDHKGFVIKDRDGIANRFASPEEIKSAQVIAS